MCSIAARNRSHGLRSVPTLWPGARPHQGLRKSETTPTLDPGCAPDGVPVNAAKANVCHLRTTVYSTGSHFAQPEPGKIFREATLLVG